MFEPDGGFAGLVSIGTAGLAPEAREAAMPEASEIRGAEGGRASEESERRFHALARISPVGIFRADTAGSCVYVNDRWCEIAGLTAGEALGEGWARSLHPEDRERVIGQWYRAVAGKRLFAAEYRFLRSDGAITWVFGQAIPEEGPEKRVVGYVGTITDITEQKRSQEQLRALSSHLQDTLETERARIAQEIHDELGALLTAIKMDLSLCLEEAGGREGFSERKDLRSHDPGRYRRPGGEKDRHRLAAEHPGRLRIVGGHRMAGPGFPGTHGHPLRAVDERPPRFGAA